MSSRDADPLVGAQLGRYRILAKLGEGGMGVVYRAHDTGLERDVALKVLPPGVTADAEARVTLLREARTASHLNHPHICTVYEVGEDGEHVFIAMELVEGGALRESVPPGGLPDETVVRYAAQVARALAHAHERGVIHRDLKTANIVIGPGGRAKLLDFGLSKRILGRGPAVVDPAVELDAIVGTPQYLAPEVLTGAIAGASSDIWSLGVVLYEMCSGAVPFAGGPGNSIVTAILHATPEPLPAHTGAGLRAVVARCLAKDPAQRYRSAGEVAAALEALLPESLQAAGRSGHRARFWRRPSRRFAVQAGAFVILAAAATAWWHFRGPGRDADAALTKTILILPMEVRGQVEDADFAGRAFAEAMVVALAQAKGVRVMPVPETGEMWSAGTLGKSRAALFAGAGRLLVGSLTREGDSLRVSVSLVDTRENRVIWGDERSGSGGDLSLLAAELVPPLAHELGAKSASGYDYFMYETGPSRLARSLEMTEAMGAVRRYELPQSVEATRLLVERFPREPDARVLRVAALLIDIVAHGPDSSRSSVIAGELEALRRLDPDNPWRDAARALLLPPAAKSIGLLSALLTRNDLTPAARGALLAMRADKFTALGDTLRAITDGEQAVQLDPASDLSLSTLARALTRAGRHGEAALRVRQALALNPTVVNYWLQLGNCMLKLGQWREYVADLEHAAELSPEADAILSAQGDGLSCLGRHRDAADCERRALLRRPERSDYGLHLALSLMRLGKWDEALPLLERACVVGSPAGCSIHAAARAVADYRLGDAAGADEQARLAATMAGSKSAAYALACYHTLRGDREAAIRLLQRFPGERWVEPAIERDPNLALLRPDARFQQVAAWMRAQPIERVFAEWGRSL